MKKDLRKMRRLLAVLLAALLVCVSLSAVFAENVEHVHTYDQGKTETIVDDENPSYESCGSQGHQAVFDTYTYPVCDTCGERGSTSDHGTQRGEILSHTFQDGVCTDCGYEGDGDDGGDGDDSHVHNFEKVGEEQDFENYRIDPDNPDHHLVDVTTFSILECTDCGETIRGDVIQEETGTYSYAHRYDGGSTCVDCQAPLSDCQHSWKPDPDSYGWVACEKCGIVCTHSFNASHVCTLCGFECENHDWENGECTVCGYQCPHDWSNKDGECTICGCYCEHDWSNKDGKCTICGYNCVHDWEDSVCTECGYVCHHNNGTEEVISHTPTQTAVQPIDDYCHADIVIISRDTVCVDCGKVLGSTPLTQTEEAVNHTYDPDTSTCTVCGHECTHSEGTHTWDDDTQTDYDHPIRVVDINDFTCRRVFNVEKVTSCVICDKEFKREPGEMECTGQHEFNDGVCWLCQHVEDPNAVCQHPNATDCDPEYGEWTYTVIPGDDVYHQQTRTVHVETFCEDCWDWFNIQDSTETVQEEHVFNSDDGVCVECGYACSHADTVYRIDEKDVPESIEEIPGDDEKHAAIKRYSRVKHCNRCGLDLESEDVAEESGTSEHNYSADEDGVCETCGHACSHPSTEEVEYLDPADEPQEGDGVSVDNRYHEISSYTYTYTICSICESELSGHHRSETPETFIEEHEYTVQADGTEKCLICGHVKEACAHENVKLEMTSDTDWWRYQEIEGDDENHRALRCYQARNVCQDCGESFPLENPPEGAVFGDGEDEIAEESLQPHEYLESGVCKLCAHVKSEPEPTPTPTPTPEPTPTPTPEPDPEPEATPTPTPAPDPEPEATPTPTPEPEPEPEATPTPTPAPDPEPEATPTPTPAPDPANDPTPTPTPDPEPEPEPENDPTPTPKPKATLEPMPTLEPVVPLELVYEPVDEDTEVSGVKASDKLPMEEALAIVGESLDAEEVTVEIPGIEKVLNEEEMAKFNQLTVQERLMVALNALGFGDILKTAMADNPDLLGEDAKALVDDIDARMAAMTQEEKDALMQLLAEQFAKETIVIDGEEYTCFCIDLVITRDGEKTYQRYAFRQDDEGKWILCQIDIGEYKPVEN